MLLTWRRGDDLLFRKPLLLLLLILLLLLLLCLAKDRDTIAAAADEEIDLVSPLDVKPETNGSTGTTG